MLLILLFSTLMLILGLSITYWLHSQYHLDVVAQLRTSLDNEVPLISVLVPARNEARNIERCVQALLVQTYPNLEVIVIDDRSTDATSQILSALLDRSQQDPISNKPNLIMLHGEELPAGWAGKPHALAQAAQKAQGDWLCCIDADTFAAPDLISAAYQTALEQDADLFSILTRQELVSFWEKVIQPLVFTALTVGFNPRRVNDQRRSEAIANGQFILLKRKVYDAVGGYTAIRDQVVEDKALAECVKKAGFRLLVGDGRQVAQTRMYTRFNEIWEGWTKNIYLGMRDRLGLLWVGVLVGVAGALVLPLWMAGGVFWFLATGQTTAWMVTVEGFLVYGVLLYARARVCKGFGISAWYALTFPLGAAVFSGMMVASVFKVLSGQGVTWKGRRYKA